MGLGSGWTDHRLSGHVLPPAEGLLSPLGFNPLLLTLFVFQQLQNVLVIPPEAIE